MDLTSGKFTAPRDGTYTFSFNGLAHFSGSSSRLLLDVDMYLNGNLIGSGLADEVNTSEYETLSFQSTLSLRKGDQLWLQTVDITTGTDLVGGANTHFSGLLLDENISHSR